MTIERWRLKKSLSGRAPLVLGVTSLVGSFVFFFLFTRLGVDPHHDGVMFASALAVRHGYKIQGGVYSQYGPVVPWIQALQLWMFGDTIHVLKIGTALALAGATGCYAYVLARLSGIWTAVCALGIWLACFPAIDDSFMMLIWSSDYLLLGSGIALVVLTIAETRNGRTQLVLLALVGSIFGFLPFTRINSGLPSLVICLLLLVYLRSSQREVVAILTGVVFALGTMFGYLTLTGSVGPWYEQSIHFPRLLYVGQLGDSGFSGIKGNSVVNGLPAMAAFGVLIYICRSLTFPRFTSSIRYLVEVCALLVASVGLWWLLWDGTKFASIEPRLMLWGVLPASVVLLPKLVRRALDVGTRQYGWSRLFLLGMGVAGLVQVFPVTDRRHLWWAVMPALGVLIAPLFEAMSRRRKAAATCLVLLLLVPQTASAAASNFNLRRHEAPNIPVLRGTLMSDDFMTAFELQLKAVDDYRKEFGKRPVLNLCMDGLFATIGGEMKLPDPYYVYWSLPKQLWTWEDRSKWVEEEKPFIWLCPPASDYEAIATSFGYRTIPKDVCIPDEDKFKAWPLIGQLAVPQEWPKLSVDSAAGDSSRCE